MPFALNPLLVDTATPPIPEAKRWAAAYDGAAGPLIDLSQAVPGYPPHPQLLKRLGEAAASREAASYGDILGDEALREIYAAHVASLYGAEVTREQVAITAGCNQAFFVAILAIAKAGDSVLLPAPWYFNHKMALDMLGISAVPLPCASASGLVPDPEEARPLIGARARAIVLVTPNNPTGAVYPKDTVRAFADLCAERGIALILDETYRDFIRGEALHDGFAAADWPETIIQLYSFSKAYCIPGHRAGAIVAGDPVIGEVAKIMDTLQICAPRVPQLALPWAIPALRDWRDTNRAEILRRAAAFADGVGVLEGWRICSIGAYFAYLEHPWPERSGSEVAEWLARERGVLALPGSFFGPDQERLLRVAFANVDVAALRSLPERLAMDRRANLLSPRHART